MLCFAKLYNMLSDTNNGQVNTDIKEIYKTSRVNVKHRNDKFLYLNDLEQLGLISFSNKNDNLNLKQELECKSIEKIVCNDSENARNP